MPTDDPYQPPSDNNSDSFPQNTTNDVKSSDTTFSSSSQNQNNQAAKSPELAITPAPAGSQVPTKYGGKKVIATIFGILLLIGGVSAGVYLVQKTIQFRQKAAESMGTIAIFKFICNEIGQQDVCNGRDTSLGNYKVDFRIYEGSNDSGNMVQTVTVKISDNQNGHGNTGDASQGRSVSSEVPKGKYTVCEVPTAYNDSGDRVPLRVEPRPPASQGGSSGGSNQTQFGQNCITVDLNPGEAELKYLDKRGTPAPTGTVTPTRSPSTTPTGAPSSTPAQTPGVTAQCGSVIAYDTNWNQLSLQALSQLKSGSVVRFAVLGTASDGTLDKARFTVNGTQGPEVTQKKPGTDQFYFEYTIPSGVTNFTVTAQIHNSIIGWF